MKLAAPISEESCATHAPGGAALLARMWLLAGSLLALIFCASCSGWLGGDLPTALPAEYIPTVIALTLQANSPDLQETLALNDTTSQTPDQPIVHTPTPEPPEDTRSPDSTTETNSLPISSTQETITSTVIVTATISPTVKSTATKTATITRRPTLTSTPSLTPRPTWTPTPTYTRRPTPTPPTPTETPLPGIPNASIQISRPGELSKIASPLRFNASLISEDAKRITIELYGEDGRLLVRQVRSYAAAPGRRTYLSLELPFEIKATAEIARLVLSMTDAKGRTLALNSVNLILLAVGQSDINPSSAMQEAIIIEQPTPLALIQGGNLLVTGKARPNTDLPLMVQLITEDGNIVGQRLTAVSTRPPGGYGDFFVEVPYKVTTLTPVRLIVYEGGETISKMTHLSSILIVLSP